MGRISKMENISIYCFWTQDTKPYRDSYFLIYHLGTSPVIQDLNKISVNKYFHVLPLIPMWVVQPQSGT